ncbi:hypothetical protein Tsubulata_014272 [Turnera subulata]|uniref:Pentacotripeptide-repeat region of PRORP domain-containing protein n=1 Tax=Turnera subulata TaxID=218843 RepID=A0A9Q0J4T0_9ROSI|nr:hypothetical protein Tsubulata_014272 [Turnera subulata]
MVLNSMAEHGISPTMVHYACVVDLLGRTGHLNEGYDIIKNLPCKPSMSILESLLGACSAHGNVELAEKLCGMMIETDPEKAGPYVMLSNIYNASERWIDAGRVRSNLEGRELRKDPGFSALLVD